LLQTLLKAIKRLTGVVPDGISQSPDFPPVVTQLLHEIEKLTNIIHQSRGLSLDWHLLDEEGVIEVSDTLYKATQIIQGLIDVAGRMASIGWDIAVVSAQEVDLEKYCSQLQHCRTLLGTQLDFLQMYVKRKLDW